MPTVWNQQSNVRETEESVDRELCIDSATPGSNQRRRLVPANPSYATRPAARLDDLGTDQFFKVSSDDERHDVDRERVGGRRRPARGDADRNDRIRL